jgi:hypothetical protein
MNFRELLKDVTDDEIESAVESLDEMELEEISIFDLPNPVVLV